MEGTAGRESNGLAHRDAIAKTKTDGGEPRKILRRASSPKGSASRNGG